MPGITCKQCGAKGYSKNPWTRTVFMDNQLEAGFSQCFKFKVDRTDPEYPKVIFTLKYVANPKKDDYENAKKALEYIQRYTGLVPIEQLACNHGDKGWDLDGPVTC